MKKTIQITTDQLQQIIKEGVSKLHKQTLIENRIKQINEELGMMRESSVMGGGDEDFTKGIYHTSKNITRDELENKLKLYLKYPDSFIDEHPYVKKRDYREEVVELEVYIIHFVKTENFNKEIFAVNYDNKEERDSDFEYFKGFIKSIEERF